METDFSIISLNENYEPQQTDQSNSPMKRKNHHDGRLTYEPKIFQNSEFLEFSGNNQDYTKIAYRERNQNIKKARVHYGVSKFALSTKFFLQNKIRDGVSGAERRLNGAEANSRWHDLFGTLNIKLQTSIFCFIYNGTGTKAYYGEAYISDSLFGFFTINENSQIPKGLRLCLPLIDIQGITKAAKTSPNTPTKKRKPLRPYIIPITDVTLKPSVIQLWTTTKEVHQFYGFGPYFDKIYDLLVSNWAQAIHHQEQNF